VERTHESRSISILRELGIAKVSEKLACCTFHIRCGVSFSYGRRFTAGPDDKHGQGSKCGIGY
jgi:hypothetical protein